MKNKILIITEEKKLAEEMAESINSRGYSAIAASSGDNGFHKIRKSSPDLVILDISEGFKTKGFNTARAITQDAAFSEIPVILLANIADARDERIKNLAVSDVLVKPFEKEVLFLAIDGHMEKTGKTRREIIKELDSLTDKWKDRQGNLIMILHEIQNHYGYVPRGIAFELARLLEMPLAKIYEVLTFYNYFKISPPGKHLISVCLGTACYLKGAGDLVSELKNVLNIEEGEVSQDGLFQLQIVRCLGCCGLAPVIMIDDDVHGNVKPDQIPDILAGYSKTKAPAGKGA